MSRDGRPENWSERLVLFQQKQTILDQTHSKCDLVWWKQQRAREEVPEVELAVCKDPERRARKASASKKDSIHADESEERSSGEASSSSDHCPRRNRQYQLAKSQRIAWECP